MRLHVGINGCSLKTPENLAVVKQIPLDLLMVETDAPWCEVKPSHASFEYLKDFKSPLLPALKKERFQMGNPVKGRNEPAMLLEILHILAKLKETNIDELAAQLLLNTKKVFQLTNI